MSVSRASELGAYELGTYTMPVVSPAVAKQLLTHLKMIKENPAQEHTQEHEAINDLVGQLVWEAVMKEKKLPDANFRIKIEETLLHHLREDPAFTSEGIMLIQQKIKPCLEALSKLREDIWQRTSDLREALTRSNARPSQAGEHLQTETGDAIHQKWQEEAKQSGRKERFKPCLSEKDKSQNEDLYKTLKNEEAGKKYLQSRHSKFKTEESFDACYRFNPEAKVWEENILKLANQQLHPSNGRENNAAAKIATELLVSFLRDKKPEDITLPKLSHWLLETVGPATHQEWLKRNTAWRECQKSDFHKLPTHEAVLDFQVLTAIQVLAGNKALLKAEPPEQKPSGPRMGGGKAE